MTRAEWASLKPGDRIAHPDTDPRVWVVTGVTEPLDLSIAGVASVVDVERDPKGAAMRLAYEEAWRIVRRAHV